MNVCPHFVVAVIEPDPEIGVVVFPSASVTCALGSCHLLYDVNKSALLSRV